MAAARDTTIAFLMVVSGGAVTPAEQEIYDDEIKLIDRGFSPAQVGEAIALLRLADDVIRGRAQWEQFESARTRAQAQNWYPLLDRYPVKMPKEDGIWQSGSAEMDFDPRHVWERTTIPTLAIFGLLDKSTPSKESARRLESALRVAGNKTFLIRTFPCADHALWCWPDQNAEWDWGRPAPGWVDFSLNWIEKNARK